MFLLGIYCQCICFLFIVDDFNLFLVMVNLVSPAGIVDEPDHAG